MPKQHLPLAWAALAICAAHRATGVLGNPNLRGIGSADHINHLQRQIATLEENVRQLLLPPVPLGSSNPWDQGNLLLLQLRLEVASAIQHLSRLKLNDGGKLVRQAEQHYRAALTLLDAAEAGGPPILSGPTADAKAPLRPRALLSLASLLVTEERTTEALALIGEGLGLMEGAADQQGGPQAKAVPRPAHVHQQPSASPSACASLLCELRISRAKALAMLGRLQEAQQGYQQAAQGAYGQDVQCYAQALAGLEAVADWQMEQLMVVLHQAEVSGLHLQQQGWGAGLPSAADAVAGTWLGALDVHDFSLLHFAVFKALDARGRHQEAWEHLARANALMAPLYFYDPAQDILQANAIMSLFRQPMLAHLAEQAHAVAKQQQATAASAAGTRALQEQDIKPIFIVGMPRSGSTLLETMLSAHPAGVWAGGERSAMAALNTEISRHLRDTGAWPEDLHALGRRYMQQMTHRAYVNGWPADRPLRYIVDKMLNNLLLFGYIELLLPDSCIVHIQRHPLDVAMSCYSLTLSHLAMAWTWDLDHIVQQVKTTNKLSRHWAEQLPGRVLTIRYEELVGTPEATMRRVLSHCGLGWDPAVLAFHTATRSVNTASLAQVRQPLYRSAVGRWQRYALQLKSVAAALAGEVAAYEAALEALEATPYGQPPSVADSETGGVRVGARDEL